MTISAPGGATDDTPSLVEQRVKQVQLYRAQVPAMPREASRGYPVPFVFEGRPFLAVPFFLRKGRPPDPQDTTLQLKANCCKGRTAAKDFQSFALKLCDIHPLFKAFQIRNEEDSFTKSESQANR